MPKIPFIITSIIVVLFIFLIYNNTYGIPNEISSDVAKNNILLGKYDYIVDVRTKKEWDEGHLPNVIHIPIGSLVTELPDKIPNKNSRILFVCKKGIRASGVVTIAHKLGYNNVQAMIGNYKELLY
jgi:rhodanese-related sulfurtransferase